ncbi:MAG: cytochrome c1 [Woeseia sp.]|nr:cytochrome c1 [Woeseia sp.]|tara:strand:- start:34 stop:774 length:741 start_codon:yes stop_codon:yes gene_type:complete
MHKTTSIGSALFFAVFLVTSGLNAATEIELQPANNDPDDIQSLQRGARNFMNYCSGCHSAKYVRFNTIGRDLEISEKQMIENLMFNADKTFDTIQVTMPVEDSARWFGTSPPDLSLIARSRGVDYIYNFLKDFYLDPGSPTGVDNRVLAGTSMPHILWELQGYQNAIFSVDEDGVQHLDRFEAVTAGTMSSDQYDGFVRDTVNFLAYISEPIRSTRRALGVKVLMFLVFFLVLATMLKKQIWKDVT